MNVVKTIAARERSYKNIQGYDIALLRLKCRQEDVFPGVIGSYHNFNSDSRPPVFACNFSSAPGYEQIVAFANEDGMVALQDTEVKRDNHRPLEATQAHNNAVFDVAWMPKELKLITASGDRSACLWDVCMSTCLQHIQSFVGHTHTIKSAVFRHEDKAVFATGARDGAIMIWDIRANHSGQPRPDNVISNAHKVKAPVRQTKRPQPSTILQSVTSLVFQDDYNLLSCSAGDGMIKVWDLRKNYTVHKKNSEAKHVLKYGGKSSTYNGFTSLLIDPLRTSLYASCIDGKIYSYNLSSYNPIPVAEYYGHLAPNKTLSFYVKACLSPDGDYLTSGSNDETAYIWRTKNPGTPYIKLCGHRDEVTCTAWCSVGDTKIVTCSDDCYHRIWRIRPDEDFVEDHQICGYVENYVFKETSPTVSPAKSVATVTSYVSTPDSITAAIHSLIHTPQSSTSSGYSETSSTGRPILSPIREKNETSPQRLIDNRFARKLHFSPSSSQLREEQQQKSPVKLNTSVTMVFSPTTGLPNFVIDGTAPHLSNSPQKSKENVDWLTKMARKRKRAEDDKDLPSPKVNNTPKVKTVKTPHAKTPSSRGKTARRPSSDQKKAPKSQRCLMPAITNFYTNLDREAT